MSDNNELEVLKFEQVNIPTAWESKEVNDDKWVYYGVDNNFPGYLLQQYDSSPIHSAIINGKSTYIQGAGLVYENGEKLNFKVNASDNVKEFVDKLVKDFLIFNYIAVEANYNVFGDVVELHHVPAHRVRTNRDKTKFWYNQDWTYNRRSKPIVYDRWTEKTSDSKSKIFWFDGYFPTIFGVYPRAEYTGALEAIATDIAIRKFNLNSIKNHFSVSNIITFYSGANINEEQKRKVIEDLRRSYQGENGKRLIVDFQNVQGKSADVKPLSAGDWDKAFTAIREDTNDDILRGHQVTSPLLFCVKTAGQLGGNSELETAYEIFKATYVEQKRAELENALNQLFINFKKVQGPVHFEDKPLFATVMDATLKQKIFTVNELRAEEGFGPLPDGDRLLSEFPRITENVVDPQGNKVKEAVVPATTPLVQHAHQFERRELSEADFERIKHLGKAKSKLHKLGNGQGVFMLSQADQVELKFENEKEIGQYIISNQVKGLTLPQLVTLIRKDTGLNMTVSSLKDTLDNLNQSGIVQVDYTDGKVSVMPSKVADVPKTKKIKVLYEYEKRDGIEGPDLLPTSRGFCKRLIENGRMYDRSEIATMSEIFQYDVWNFCGGYYNNPQTGETQPFCRHQWNAYSVFDPEEE